MPKCYSCGKEEVKNPLDIWTNCYIATLMINDAISKVSNQMVTCVWCKNHHREREDGKCPRCGSYWEG